MTPFLQMRLGIRITLAVLIAFLVAFSIFSVTLLMFHYKIEHLKLISKDVDLIQQRFYTQHFDPNEKKIFVLGSSQVQGLNATRITEYLSSNNEHYRVYDLGLAGDVPSSRLRTIDMIIFAKPDIVVYGISDRDFVATLTDKFPMKKFLPDPHDMFVELFSKTVRNYDIHFLQSPKLDILRFIQKHTETSRVISEIGNMNDTEHYQDTPFINFTKEHHIIAADEDLKKSGQNEPESRYIPPPVRNENVIALIKIINKLHENNISVIVFTTPVQRYHLDNTPNDEKEAFDLVLKKISDESHVTIYSLYDKYADLPIFHDTLHIAINKNSTIYSDDVAKIILNEVEH